ncbi:trypsin II-P29-like [Ctenodactylus gundi]
MIHRVDTIRLGLHSRSLRRLRGSQMVKPHLLLPHPCCWPSIPRLDDVMLIKLRHAVKLSATVQPISITSKTAEAGTRCSISGWGRSWNSTHAEYLQCLETTVLSTETCGAIYPAGKHSSMFCTYAETNQGASPGDAGGPVICGGKLQGIINGGSLGKDINTDIHINVFMYNDWIKRTIETYQRFTSGA